MEPFDGTLARLATLPGAALDRPWSWRQRETTVREAFYRSLEEEQMALAGLIPPAGEAARILALAQRAFSELRGLLVGLPDALLDSPPPAGEWSLRTILSHVLTTERRYAQHTQYAVQRADADPVETPRDRLPPLHGADTPGSLADLLAHLATARAETDHALAGLPDHALARPTVWAGYQVDVRFRLHRFAAHLIEHTIQGEKTLEALGVPQTEARRLVRRLAAARGAHERLSGAQQLQALDAVHADRAGAL